MRNRYVTRRNKQAAPQLELLEDRRLLSSMTSVALLAPATPVYTSGPGLVQLDSQTAVILAQNSANGSAAAPDTGANNPSSGPTQSNTNPNNDVPADQTSSAGQANANQSQVSSGGTTADPNAGTNQGQTGNDGSTTNPTTGTDSTAASNNGTATDPNAGYDGAIATSTGAAGDQSTSANQVTLNFDPVAVDQFGWSVTVAPVGLNSSASAGQIVTGNDSAASLGSRLDGSDPGAEEGLRHADRSRLLLEMALTTTQFGDRLNDCALASHREAVAESVTQEEGTLSAHEPERVNLGHAGCPEHFLDATLASPVDVTAVAGSLSEMRITRLEAPSGSMRQGPDSAPQGADLIAGLSVSERSSLDGALEDFMRQMAALGQELGGSIDGLGIAPWITTLAMAATAYEVSRRHKGTCRPGLAGDGSATLTWFAGLPGSLSTEHA